MIDALPPGDGRSISALRATIPRDEGEERFRVLFEHAVLGMCFVALDGTFVQTNQRLSEIVGYAREELAAMTCVELTHPADRSKEKVATSHMLSGGPHAATWEKRYIRKDGTPLWCNLTLTLICDERGEAKQFVGVIEDITERKRAMQRLDESESLMRIAGQAAHIGGWAIEPIDRGCMLSDEVRAIFDFPRGSIADFDVVLGYFREASRTRLVGAIALSRATGVGFDLELDIETKRGRRRWVRAIGNVESEGDRIVGALQDITERRASDLEMMRMNRALKMLSGCNEVLVRATDEAQLLADICELCVEVGGYAMAGVGYARQDARRTIEVVGSAGLCDGYFEQVQIGWGEGDPAGDGAAGRTIRSGRPTVVVDTATDERFGAWRGPALARGFRSLVVLPLRDKDATFGMLGLYAADVREPPQAEIALLQQMANDLAFGIGHLRAQVERARIADAVLKISAAVSASGGTAFLEQLVANMADAVGAQAAVIVREHPTDPTKMQTVAAVFEGVTSVPMEFVVEGSPCTDVRVDEIFVVEANLGARYPACSVAAAIGSQAVVGCRLQGAGEQKLATMMVFFRDPLVDVEFTTSTLKIFVARAAAELERQAADARIADQASWLDRARDAIVVRDIAGHISFWNKSAERLYGWRGDEIVGTTAGDSLFADSARLREATATVVAAGFWNGEVEHRRKDGTLVWVESRWSIVTDDSGVARSILAIDTDITERNVAKREIEHLAFYDTLTNLPNRLLLVKRLKGLLSEMTGYGALLFIDLDNFKTLNDTLGHDMGDLLLRAVSARVKSSVRGADLVARLGGDEFVVMLEQLGDTLEEATGAARRIAGDILAASNLPYELDGIDHTNTPSIGVTLFGRDDNTDDLLKQADLAMYQAKAAGRNTVRFFDPQMQAFAIARRALENDIRSALRSDEFSVVFQPQIDDADRVIGAETLVRWTHATRGVVSPVDFIPVAEESGLIVALGRRVLELACEQLFAWAALPHMARLKVSVNVSAREFRQPDFVGCVVATLVATGADPYRLVLELTESVLVDDIDVVIAKMSALREIGIGFSLDDFGTGYSSLAYLKRLPLYQLKIDQTFVRDVLVDANDAVIARTIVALGQSLSLDVIAEGVETREQRQFLATAGCRSYQGYLFSRPIVAHAFEVFVRDHS